MIRVALVNQSETKKFTHEAGPLEFGRGPQRQVPRCIVADPYVSRDHLRIDELSGGRLRVTNLSHSSPVLIGDDAALEMGASCDLSLPIRLRLGKTSIDLEACLDAEHLQRQTTSTIAISPPGSHARALRELGDTPDVQTLAHWFETVIAVQQAAVGSTEFYKQTARAVVDLVGLDRGLVLLREQNDWRVVALEASAEQSGPNYSRTVLDEVLRCKRTFYQHLEDAGLRESLVNVEAVVAAPVLDHGGEVVGVVYGSRARRPGQACALIQPLEAQIVQVLAAAVAVGLARLYQEAEAVRAQVQFEQFFSAKLAKELARDAGMLEGREREITILFTDMRNFSAVSEQLGPQNVFRLMQELMELQSDTIRQFDGVVVDYYGDGLLAMWNAPTDQADHAALACQTALAIVRRLPEMRQAWQTKLQQPLNIGVGINTGLALVGNTGSRVKLKYGPMGAAVNVANRVERAVKHFGVSILITDTTRAALDESWPTRRLGKVRLAGVASPVELFELSLEEQESGWRQRRDAFERALTHYEAGRWAEACQELYPLLRAEEGRYDVPSLQLLGRAVDCLKSPPAHFDPTADLTKI